MAARRCGRARGCARCSVAAFLARSTRPDPSQGTIDIAFQLYPASRAPPPAPSSPSRAARATPPRVRRLVPGVVRAVAGHPRGAHRRQPGHRGIGCDRLPSPPVVPRRLSRRGGRLRGATRLDQRRVRHRLRRRRPRRRPRPSRHRRRSTCTAIRTGPTSPKRSRCAIPTGSALSPSTPPTRWRASTRGIETSTGRWWTPSGRFAPATVQCAAAGGDPIDRLRRWPTRSPSGR